VPFRNASRIFRSWRMKGRRVDIPDKQS
jgi:hypothetical protein